ncbi:MAG: hypothetical protein F6K31_43925 [Symploca sp. SIO2G7]|nr:hypothetical protein [Symploca sp. SIO2G7]
MQDKQEKQLFTEITTEESATVNGGGGCGYYVPRYRRSSYYNYRRPRRHYNQTVNVYFNTPRYY